MTDTSLEEKASRPADNDNPESIVVVADTSLGGDTTAKEGKRDVDNDNPESIEMANTSLEMGHEPTDKEGKRPIDKDNADPMIKVEGIDDTKEAKIVFEQATPDVQLSEDIKSLLESLELPEEFKTKALGMFEGAIALRVADIKKEMFKLNEAVMAEYKTTLATKVEESTDTYVSEAVAKWLEENQTQVKSNVRTQIAESFMANLLNLLESHYITIPEGKEDILETTLAKADDLQVKLDEQIKLNESLKESTKDAEKALVVESLVKSLTDTQAERVRTLAEGVEFDLKDSFKTKLTAIVESLTKVNADKPSTSLLEDVQGEVVIKEEVTKPKSTISPLVQRLSDDLKALGNK
jgi:hypothetical protein